MEKGDSDRVKKLFCLEKLKPNVGEFNKTNSDCYKLGILDSAAGGATYLFRSNNMDSDNNVLSI